MLKLIIVLSADYATFLESLQQHILDYFSNIIEEAIINAYNEAK